MKTLILTLAGIMTLLALTSCASRTNAQQKSVNGAIFGAGLGAVIGHQSGNRDKGLLIGGVLGGTVGHAIGSSQDKKEAANRE